MRPIFIRATVLALLAGLVGCAADAPTGPHTGGGGTSSALQINLFTNDPNPSAGACSLVQAIATLNGTNVANGTGIVFTSDLGAFAQNGQSNISAVTSGGTSSVSLCSNQSGVATVRASVSVSGKNASATLPVSFQPSSSQVFLTFCSPAFGTPDGGTTLTINGGRFFGTPATTRVAFISAGITREGLVTALTNNAITVTTPSFPEAASQSVQIKITLGAGTASPVTVTAPNCFVFGNGGSSTPVINAILPSSGRNSGNTRVTIFGSGFAQPLQVFFGSVEAAVQSVSFSQIVVLSPPAAGAGAGNLNATVDVRVHEVNTGSDGTLAGGFRYTPAVQIISFEGANIQPFSGPFSPVTIHGQGFEAPVKVGLAGFVASIISVSATEIVVLPGPAAAVNCNDITGPMTVTNIDTGDSASGQSFTYLVKGASPFITSIVPSSGAPGDSITIHGANLFGAVVTIGGAGAQITGGAADGSTLTVVVPPSSSTAPTCGASTPGTPLPAGSPQDVVVTNGATSCTTTFPKGFQYVLPCVP